MSFDQIAWLPLCAGLTGVGLLLSFLRMRRAGALSGLRGVAWSLLPLAAYLTGALPTVWQIGTAIVGFVTGAVLNPMVWAGVALAVLSAVLFVVTGAVRGRRLRTAGSGRAAESPDGGAGAAGGGAVRGSSGTRPLSRPGAAPADPARSASGSGTQPMARPGAQPAGKRSGKPAASSDDDFSDIEDILKRRGIG
ncbi:cellulose synthase [Streptosporangium sp. NPDC004379]|uniref:cellulose synthase n=1 Tax=Streptosporangium sp. NPDC004379 TaxID=3366189 RepID=UPI0036D13F71